MNFDFKNMLINFSGSNAFSMYNEENHQLSEIVCSCISKFIVLKEHVENFIFMYSSVILDSTLINTILDIGKVIGTVLMKLFFVFFSMYNVLKKCLYYLTKFA